ncbi:hypothetical protein [Dichotomicrobium thermohalophilum]|uniref:Uncharacterized protein n=1 Tax=Dichotomicrobium thermohalophilum TaxID=933063 RepID=A0A397Q7T9_9HYPH|nr:hypothetical protein [Dichotomicrobium thermohalophilum]RIA55567.1 hypothetical protein BXY53_0636 [Dichotomicrobium thermohalophilum]
MDWATIFIGIIALIGGIAIGLKLQANNDRHKIKELMRSQAHDRFHYLATLRREIANILIWQNPDRFLAMYENIMLELQNVSDMNRDALKKRFDDLVEKYPHFIDFDAIGTKDYVLYPDAIDWKTNNDLEEYYKDNLRFTFYATELVKSWQIFRYYRNPHVDHARRYAQRVKDTHLKEKMLHAVETIDVVKRYGDIDFDFELDSDKFHAKRLFPDTPDLQIGIHLKKENEYGIYSVFVDDKIFKNYYRSCPNFETQQPLDTINDWNKILYLEE